MSRKKNRFEFEAEDEPAFRSADPLLSASEEPESYYIDEPEPPYRKKSRAGWFVALGLLLIALLGAGLWYFFSYTKKEAPSSPIADRFSRVSESLEEGYFIPEEKVSPELRRAIALYHDREFDSARRAFEKFLDSSASDKEKAIAEVFLGILAAERGKATLAEHHLLRALRFSPEYLPALVNLAILMRRIGNFERAHEYAEAAKRRAPNEPHVAALLANILAAGQKTEEAIEAYDEALKHSPEDAANHYNKGLALLHAERYDEAILSFSRALKFGSGRVRVLSHAHLAQIYVHRGNLELARHHLEKAVALAPDNGKYFYNLGVVELRMGERKAALSSFRRALDAGTNEARVYRSLARAFEELKEPARAVKALRQALYLKPGDLPSLFALGELYLRQNDLLNAKDIYQKIVNTTPGDQNTEEALLKLAGIYVRMEEPNEAIAMLEKARALNPRNIKLYFLLGQVYEKSGKRALALETWKKALQMASAASPGGAAIPLSRSEERQIRMAIAQSYLKEGAPELALKEYEAIRIRNKKPPVIELDSGLELARADAYLALRDYPNAIASLEKALADPKLGLGQRKTAYLQLALAYQRQGGSENLSLARAQINKAVRLDPLDMDTKLMQAQILMQTDSLVDREKALEVLLAVTQSDLDAKTASRAQNLLGLVYMKNGEYRRALEAFDYAVQLDPANKEAYHNQRVAAAKYEAGK